MKAPFHPILVPLIFSVRNTTLSIAFALSFLTLIPDARAACGKQCKAAKTYCKNWKHKNPGEECGTVRGLACTGKSWKKIKQVNALWAACRLVKGENHIKKAKARCREFETHWGGKCEVQSPRCKAGWVKLGKFGKFRACRPIQVTWNMRYNAYKAFMRKFEGKAKFTMHPALAEFVRRNYKLNPAKVRWGYASNTPSTCITDCSRIYCNKQWIIDRVRNGLTGDAAIIFHELGHVEQCASKGSRKNYAKLWFNSLPRGFFGALNPEIKGKFKDKIHDAMPMEKQAERKGQFALKKYTAGWWHKRARCRVYKSDRRSVVYTSNNAHPRHFCDPKFKQRGAKGLRSQAAKAARTHGRGTYYFAFGMPHEKVGGRANGVWIGKATFGPRRASLGAN
ncbi:MAG: hypothetical protein ACR2PG_25235 [Hyphomicrobiaceae bacterium]